MITTIRKLAPGDDLNIVSSLIYETDKYFLPTLFEDNKDIAVVTGNNNEKILELNAKGKSNVEIAKELGLGIGEVKLVIDLFRGGK